MIDPGKFQLYCSNPAEFRRDLVVEAGSDSALLGDVLDPWQRADFEATDSGWRCAVGFAEEEPIRRAYLERPRGHSKTSDLAVMCTWALVCSRRIIRGYGVAADRDQARLLRNAIAKLIRLNPWLVKVLDVQNYVIRNIAEKHPGKDSELKINSSDVGSSYGILPDFIICDELTHWSNEELWTSTVSSVGKKPTCMLVVISNAGLGQGDSWQWTAREQARSLPYWHFSRLDGPQASWLSEQDLEEQRLLLPGKAYQRLWLNQWTTGGDAFDGALIDSCVVLDGPLVKRVKSRDLVRYIGGLDLGVKHDHSAFVLLEADLEDNQVRLARCQSWKPDKATGQVDLQMVMEFVKEMHREFGLRRVWFDPSQALLMAQMLRRAGVRMEEMNFVGRNLNVMASTLLETISNQRILLYRDKDLIRDLLRLNIVQKSFGFKLEADATAESGHADRAIALAIALPDAMNFSQGKRRSLPLPVGRSSQSPATHLPARLT